MLEDLDKCSGDNYSEAMVEPDTLGEGLSNRHSDNYESLSGKFWDNELGDALNNLKQLEAKQKVAELLEMIAEKPFEIIDCGFIRAFERQGKAELDESVRRLNKIDLRPLFWNSLDYRR